MHCYVTDKHNAFQYSQISFHCDERAEMELVVCRPDRVFQSITGFGAALTEASAYVFAQMPPRIQDECMWLCFGEGHTGNAYTLCRTHIQSCDFALGNYSYVRPFDRTLRSFSLKRDQQLLLPFIQCALAINPQMQLIAAPWSPPAFMKTNGRMNGGGRLRLSCYETYAQLLAKYVAAYAEAGVHIGRMSIQNEPMARQTWDSCLFSAEEEVRFAARYLRPALDAAGFEEVRLFAWDHNTDRLYDRIEASIACATQEAVSASGEAVAASREAASQAAASQAAARETFDGVAFHWYAGDHFEQVQAVAQTYPDKEILLTEGCVEYTHDQAQNATQERKAEQYAHYVMGCMNAGAAGFIDWNILLDERGGPNHVRNFCEAPLMYDRETQELLVNRSFYYLGHFSRFVVPGSRRFLTSRYTDKVECAGFIRPDGTRVLVLLNRQNDNVRFRVTERPFVADCKAPAHSIMTMVWDADEVFVA